MGNTDIHCTEEDRGEGESEGERGERERGGERGSLWYWGREMKCVWLLQVLLL